MWAWRSPPEERIEWADSFIQQILRTYYMPGTVMSTENTPVKKKVKVFALLRLAWYLWGRQTRNKYN